MLKKIICFITAAILAVNLTGCGSPKSTANTSIPTYEEKEIGSKSNLSAPGGSRINSKGQLVVYDGGSSGPRYVTLDSEGNPVGEIKAGFEEDGSLFALDSSDNLYVVVRNPKSMEDISFQLYMISAKGETLKTVDLKTAAAGKGMMGPGISDIAVDSKGNIYLAKSQESIEVLDKDGNHVKNIGSEDYSGICMDEDNNVIAVSFSMKDGSSKLEKINSSTGKSIWKQDLSSNGGRITAGQKKICYVKADKSIYMIDEAGVKMYDSQGKPMGTVLDFASYTLLALGYNISDFVVDTSKNIYVVTTEMKMLKQNGAGGKQIGKGNGPGNAKIQKGNGEQVDSAAVKGGPVLFGGDAKYEIYKYTINTGEKSAEEKKTITVAARRMDRFLQIAASKFQKDNPDYKIKIETPPSEEGNAAGPSGDQSREEIEKYKNSLNTKILSGNGPDIICTNILPYEKYVSKNILANLSEMMSNDKSFDMSKYYSNIFDGMKYNGNIYALPITFSFSAMMANKDILDKESITIDDSKWTWNDFKAIAEKVTDNKAGRTALPNVSCSDLLELLGRGNYSKFVDTQAKKANFDSREFIEMLNIIKSFGDSKLASKGAKQEMGQILDAAGRGALVFYPDTINDYMFYGFMKSMIQGSNLTLLNYPAYENGSTGEFSTEYSFGINNNSKYKDKAWEFLKILLSDEIQGSMELSGFSVNKAAQQSKTKQALEMTSKGNVKMMIKGGNDSKPITPKISQSDVDYINKFIDGLKTCVSVDDNIASIVLDETKAFFSGSKTAEEVAKLIQNRVNTYLGE